MKDKTLLICHIYPVAVGMFLFAVLTFAVDEAAAKKSINERLTTEAWDAYVAHDYEAAIRKADECIDKFESRADELQKELDDGKVKVPENPEDEKEKREIFKRGPLNDVATCFFIKGEAHLKLGQSDKSPEGKKH